MTAAMTLSGGANRREGRNSVVPMMVFLVVAVMQLVFVAEIGTDVPIYDQWDAEGAFLYPKWLDGTLTFSDLFRGHNEHRIFWTRVIDLGVFALNGQWDPLVQLVVNALIRAGLAALVAGFLAGGRKPSIQAAVAAGVVLLHLPHIAWGNALCGFQSQVYLVLMFSVISLACLSGEKRGGVRLMGGLMAGTAALFAMGAGAFVPPVLLGLAALHAAERRRLDQQVWCESWPALVLLVAALVSMVSVPGHNGFAPNTMAQFLNAFGRAMAWPHTWMPAAAFVLNLPLGIAVALRLARKRRAGAGEDFVLLLGGWSAVAAAAMGWTRGGGTEFDGGVTPRYVDFLIFLPLANVWCAALLAGETKLLSRTIAWLLAGAWAVFLLMGWIGASSHALRGLVVPRWRDRDFPVRLLVAFQRSGDPGVFRGIPPVLLPHPRSEAVWAVLQDSRLSGYLPPPLQPDRPVGPLSRFVRWILRR